MCLHTVLESSQHYKWLTFCYKACLGSSCICCIKYSSYACNSKRVKALNLAHGWPIGQMVSPAPLEMIPEHRASCKPWAPPAMAPKQNNTLILYDCVMKYHKCSTLEQYPVGSNSVPWDWGSWFIFHQLLTRLEFNTLLNSSGCGQIWWPEVVEESPQFYGWLSASCLDLPQKQSLWCGLFQLQRQWSLSEIFLMLWNAEFGDSPFYLGVTR